MGCKQLSKAAHEELIKTNPDAQSYDQENKCKCCNDTPGCLFCLFYNSGNCGSSCLGQQGEEYQPYPDTEPNYCVCRIKITADAGETLSQLTSRCETIRQQIGQGYQIFNGWCCDSTCKYKTCEGTWPYG